MRVYFKYKLLFTEISGMLMSRIRRRTYLFVALVLAGAVLLASLYFSNIGRPPESPISNPNLPTLTYYTEQFPPYNYQENDTLKGVAVDLLGEITAKMGTTVTPDQVHLVLDRRIPSRPNLKKRRTFLHLSVTREGAIIQVGRAH